VTTQLQLINIIIIIIIIIITWAEEIRGLMEEKGLTLWRRNYLF
jgi:hypothetical protein